MKSLRLFSALKKLSYEKMPYVIKVCIYILIFYNLLSYSTAQPIATSINDCGGTTLENKYPWIVGVYDLDEKLICSGTIISPYHVVTAAQCFPLNITNSNYEIDHQKYIIKTAKYYNNIDARDNSQQFRKIEKYVIHQDYKHSSGTKEHDIILLETDREFEFFEHVRPACIDWQLFYEEWDFKNGNEGIAVGWKDDKNTMTLCEVSNVHFLQKNTCWENLSDDFRSKYFSYDKFCAEYIDDKSICGKEVGTGLFFKTYGQRYFLRGITSIFSEKSKNYVLYTKISNYLDWIKYHIGRNERIYPNFATYGKEPRQATSGCILPQHLQYGKFSFVTGKTYQEGAWVPSLTIVLLSCEESNASASYFHCLDKKWEPLIDEVVCKKPGSCPSFIDSGAEEVNCKLDGQPISCTEPPTNATVDVVCKSPYPRGKPRYRCQDGKWDPQVTSCIIDYLASLIRPRVTDIPDGWPKDSCRSLKTTLSEEDDCYINGVATVCQNFSIPDTEIVKKCRPGYITHSKKNATYTCGENAKWVPSYDLCQPDCSVKTSSNHDPRNVAIYDSHEKLLCSGTIISAYHVVTVARCFPMVFLDDENYELDHQKFTIVAGACNFNKNESENSRQIRKIAKVIMHEDYKFWLSAREYDIILIEVDREFEFSDHVRPACVDWEAYYEGNVNDGTRGLVVSWKHDKHDEVTCQFSKVQYIQEKCRSNVSSDFGYDKFCAIHGNESNQALGSGLYFEVEERYFILGIASIFNQESESYVLYTNISNYLEWLKYYMRKIERISPNFESFKIDTVKLDGCMSPQHLTYGNFSYLSSKVYQPNMLVSSRTFIYLSCNSNRKLAFICLWKSWHPPIEDSLCPQPGLCPLLASSESEEVFCKLNGIPSNCEAPLSNTTAVAVCKPFYTSPRQPIYKCYEGEWQPKFRKCRLECGVKQESAIEGDASFGNPYPWVVVIYENGTQVCLGTLISSSFVITAVNCLWEATEVEDRRNDFTIIAGKNFRNIDTEEHGLQKRKIKQLYTKRKYSKDNFRKGFALIELDKQITPSTHVLPVCVEARDSYLNDNDLIFGDMGVTAGWKYVNQSGHLDYVLEAYSVTLEPRDVCLGGLSDDYKNIHYTSDLICARNKNNSKSDCLGDNGRGLYFKSVDAHYSIRGVLNLSKFIKSGCEMKRLALFSKILNDDFTPKNEPFFNKAAIIASLVG